MGGIQSVALKQVHSSERNQKTLTKLKSKKVVRLKSVKKSKSERVRALSVHKQQDLVLEFRVKARKLARSILRRWHARLDLQEVDSIVDLSLCESVRRFNPKMGASFMTFMFYHLRGNLIRAITAAATNNSVPFPDFDPSDFASDGRTERNVKNIGSAIEIAQALCNHENILPDEVLYRKEVARISQEACAQLDPLAQEIVQRIFMEEQQLVDIASSLGYSRCHISRVKKKALDELHEHLKNTLSPEGQNIVAGEGTIANADDMEISRRSAKRARVALLKAKKIARRKFISDAQAA